MEIKHRIQFGCDTDELADKVLSGEKTATSSLYDYSLMNQEEIKVNECASILDSQGKEKCIVKIERIEIVDFQDITEEFAVNELTLLCPHSLFGISYLYGMFHIL